MGLQGVHQVLAHSAARHNALPPRRTTHTHRASVPDDSLAVHLLKFKSLLSYHLLPQPHVNLLGKSVFNFSLSSILVGRAAPATDAVRGLPCCSA